MFRIPTPIISRGGGMESPVGEDIPATSAFEEALRNWLLEADRLEEPPEQLLHGLVDQFAQQGIHLLTSSASFVLCTPSSRCSPNAGDLSWSRR